MEATTNPFHLHDDSKSLPEVQPLHPPTNLHHLEEIGLQAEEQRGERAIEEKYYQEFKKIYLTSYKLWTEAKKQSKIKDNLTHKITTIENQLSSLHKARKVEQQVQQQQQNQQDRRANKRTRRTAQQIQRKFNCRADFCGRCYGSQGSLQQHIKLKHPELYKREHSQSSE